VRLAKTTGPPSPLIKESGVKEARHIPDHDGWMARSPKLARLAAPPTPRVPGGQSVGAPPPKGLILRAEAGPGVNMGIPAGSRLEMEADAWPRSWTTLSGDNVKFAEKAQPQPP
jgi:hypothetical protein